MSNHPFMAAPGRYDEHWVSKGLCAAEDPEAPYRPGRRAVAAQKERCGRCLVQVPCLQAALDRDERWGVWGGKTTPERRVILRAGLTAAEALMAEPVVFPAAPIPQASTRAA